MIDLYKIANRPRHPGQAPASHALHSAALRICVPLTMVLLAVFAPRCIAADSPDIKSNASADRVFFRNGDALGGTLKSIDPQSSIVWMRSDTLEPIAFESTNILYIDLAQRQGLGTAPAAGTCRVQFRNGDLLEGALLSCDLENVHLNTKYAGPVTLPRKHIKTMIFIPPLGSAVYDGPNGLEEWTQGKSALAAIGNAGQWSYRNGAFYATRPASIARDLKLPDVASIQMDIRWQGFLNMAIALYSDSLQPVSLKDKENEPDFGGFYSFQLNNYSASLIAITKRDPLRHLEPAMIPLMSQTNQVHLDLRINKQRHTVAMLVNGILIREWNDTNGFAGAGTGLRFVHQGGGAIKLSNLRITRWNGELEQKPVITPDGRKDAAHLADGKLIVGSVQSITNGQLTMSIAEANFTGPLSQLRRLDFKDQKLQKLPLNPGEIRAYFGQWGRLTLHLEQWDLETMQGTNSILGKVNINSGFCTRLQFRLAP